MIGLALPLPIVGGGADFDSEGEGWFINFYNCPCGAEWADEWSATSDDDCPECGTTCSPTRSEDA